MSTARDAHTATLLSSGKVLASAGYTNSGVTADAELYDPASNTWSAAATRAVPHRRANARARPDRGHRSHTTHNSMRVRERLSADSGGN